ncbi:hypothetical protein HDU82_007178 [Entophlyctis luteolus]|nr:hypothetical protein HDU82_007178 [Entophlyctis luteolus]
MDSIQTLTPSQIAAWLARCGFGDVAPAFERHAISGRCLKYLTHELLREIGVEKVGTQKRILMLIEAYGTSSFSCLHQSYRNAPHAVPTPASEARRHLQRAYEALYGKQPGMSAAEIATQASVAAKALDPVAAVNLLPPGAPGNVPIRTASAPAEGTTASSPVQRQPQPVPAVVRSLPPSNSSELPKIDSDLIHQSPQAKSGSNPDASPKNAETTKERVILNASINFSVVDGNQESHKIEVLKFVDDGAAIRKSILTKFKISSENWNQYALFYKEGNFRGGGMTLNDDDLRRICDESQYPWRIELILRKSFDLRRNQDVSQQTGTTNPTSPSTMLFATPQQILSEAKDKNINRPVIEEPNRKFSKPSFAGDTIESKSGFPRTSSQKMGLRRKEEQPGVMEAVEQRPKSGGRDVKVKSFFAERPRDEAIADKLKKYFPQIVEEPEQTDSAEGSGQLNFSTEWQKSSIVQDAGDGSSTKSLYGSTSPITSTTSLTPIRSGILQNLQSKVDAAVENKKRASIFSSLAVRNRLSMAAGLKYRERNESLKAKERILNEYRHSRMEVQLPPPDMGVKPPKPIVEVGAAKKSPVVESVATTHSVRPESTAVAPTITHWTRGKLIGQGAFGKVYHGLNLDTGDFMAVKQVLIGPPPNQKRAGGGSNEKSKQIEALEREIEFLKELSHENIVRYLGFELVDASLNVFLQYVSGGSISSLLSKTGKLDLLVARYFTFQVLCGMAYLHSKNIIHRDIKGANILVDVDGISLAYQRMTRMSMQGTIQWMAPEVAVANQSASMASTAPTKPDGPKKGYSAKVDIWSLGCVVLEMLSGKAPWHEVSQALQVILHLGHGKRPAFPTELPESAQAFLDSAFTVDPEQRPTALELLEKDFCRLSTSETEHFDFQSWVLEAERRHAEEVGAEVDESESDSSETESDGVAERLENAEQDSESDEGEKSSDDAWRPEPVLTELEPEREWNEKRATTGRWLVSDDGSDVA